MFGIRPEALTDPEGADRTSSKIIHQSCMIEVVEPAGSDTFAVINLGGNEAIARLRADASVVEGAETQLAFNMAKAVFFDPNTTQRIR